MKPSILIPVALALLLNPSIRAAETGVSSLKTFSTAGKQVSLLSTEKESELFRHEGKGCLTHMWFGGAFKGIEQTRIRVYVDGESTASIDMELYLGHGIGFDDNFAPWGTARIGKTGDPNSVYNTYRIPFGKSIRVTGQLAPGPVEHPLFWWIIRGTENLPVSLGGVTLPENARLKLYKLENKTTQPLEEFALCKVQGAGLLYLVTMAVQGQRKTGDWKDLGFMEGCLRAYLNGASKPEFLASGLEDYFLGSGYFHQNQRYYGAVAGLTHIDKTNSAFSAYRFHDDDPVFFKTALKLTCRCGEELNGKMLHDPPSTVFTAYTWVYQW